MNGLIPGTGRFTPAGSGGALTAARGNLTAAWAAETFLRVARDRPATSPMAAAATVTPAVTRNVRRSADAVTTGPPVSTLAVPARAGTEPAPPGPRPAPLDPRPAPLGPRPAPPGPPGPRPAPLGPRPGSPASRPPRGRSGARSSSASSALPAPSGFGVSS